MTKKVFVGKLKADLAMLAFVLIAIVMVSTTSVGVLAYAAAADGPRPVVSQSNEQPTAFPPTVRTTGQGG